MSSTSDTLDPTGHIPITMRSAIRVPAPLPRSNFSIRESIIDSKWDLICVMEAAAHLARPDPAILPGARRLVVVPQSIGPGIV